MERKSAQSFPGRAGDLTKACEGEAMKPLSRLGWSVLTGCAWLGVAVWHEAPTWASALSFLLGLTLAAIYYECRGKG